MKIRKWCYWSGLNTFLQQEWKECKLTDKINSRYKKMGLNYILNLFLNVSKVSLSILISYALIKKHTQIACLLLLMISCLLHFNRNWKLKRSVYIVKSRQRYDKTLNSFLLHMSNHALKDIYMIRLNYGTINNTNSLYYSSLEVLIDFINPFIAILVFYKQLHFLLQLRATYGHVSS